MSLWLLLFLAFIPQEPVTSNALLLKVYQLHYNMWFVHLLFVVATILDILVGYCLGVYFYRHFEKSKVAIYAKEKAEQFKTFAGNQSLNIAFLIYGPIIFPLSAFIAPWLGVSFWSTFIYLFIGDLIIWYGGEWLLVLGINFIPDPELALFGILFLSVLIAGGIRYYRNHKK